MIYINDIRKLKKIDINENNFYVVIDFDRTITSMDSIDSWDAAGEILPNEFKEELNELYQKYGPIERDYQIEFKEKEKAMIEWYARCMELYYKYDLTKEKLVQSIEKSNLIFRKGVKSFLRDMHNKHIPVIILSAGIGNVIEQFLKINNCYTSNIYIISNFIKFNDEGKMKKFDEDMIHSLNKTMKNHLPIKIKEDLDKKTYKLLFGDLIEDTKMVDEEELENTITVCFLNKKTEQNLAKFEENFDIVLTNDDSNFDVIKEVVKIKK